MKKISRTRLWGMIQAACLTALLAYGGTSRADPASDWYGALQGCWQQEGAQSTGEMFCVNGTNFRASIFLPTEPSLAALGIPGQLLFLCGDFPNQQITSGTSFPLAINSNRANGALQVAGPIGSLTAICFDSNSNPFVVAPHMAPRRIPIPFLSDSADSGTSLVDHHRLITPKGNYVRAVASQSLSVRVILQDPGLGFYTSGGADGDIGQAWGDVLGRNPTQADLDYWRGQIPFVGISELRRTLSTGGEASALIAQYRQRILGQSTADADLAWASQVISSQGLYKFQALIATNTLAQLRSNMLDQPTASADVSWATNRIQAIGFSQFEMELAASSNYVARTRLLMGGWGTADADQSWGLDYIYRYGYRTYEQLLASYENGKYARGIRADILGQATNGADIAWIGSTIATIGRKGVESALAQSNNAQPIRDLRSRFLRAASTNGDDIAWAQNVLLNYSNGFRGLAAVIAGLNGGESVRFLRDQIGGWATSSADANWAIDYIRQNGPNAFDGFVAGANAGAGIRRARQIRGNLVTSDQDVQIGLTSILQRGFLPTFGYR